MFVFLPSSFVAEACRNKRERDKFTPEDLDEEKVEDTRDPVTQ